MWNRHKMKWVVVLAGRCFNSKLVRDQAPHCPVPKGELFSHGPKAASRLPLCL